MRFVLHHLLVEGDPFLVLRRREVPERRVQPCDARWPVSADQAFAARYRNREPRSQAPPLTYTTNDDRESRVLERLQGV